MNGVARVKWIAGFDMERLIGAILWRGMLLSAALIMAGVLLLWIGIGRAEFIPTLQGTNALHLVLSDLRRIASAGSWPTLLIHSGIVVLFYTPYARVIASMAYFARIHRSWKHALFGSLVFAVLTYVLFLG